MAEKITRDLVRELGVLSRSDSGWSKELNLVSWNGRVPKLDLREWSGGKEKIGKGLTLKKSEAMRLRDILNELDFNAIPNSDGVMDSDPIRNVESVPSTDEIQGTRSIQGMTPIQEKRPAQEPALIKEIAPVHTDVLVQDEVAIEHSEHLACSESAQKPSVFVSVDSAPSAEEVVAV